MSIVLCMTKHRPVAHAAHRTLRRATHGRAPAVHSLATRNVEEAHGRGARGAAAPGEARAALARRAGRPGAGGCWAGWPGAGRGGAGPGRGVIRIALARALRQAAQLARPGAARHDGRVRHQAATRLVRRGLPRRAVDVGPALARVRLACCEAHKGRVPGGQARPVRQEQLVARAKVPAQALGGVRPIVRACQGGPWVGGQEDKRLLVQAGAVRHVVAEAVHAGVCKRGRGAGRPRAGEGWAGRPRAGEGWAARCGAGWGRAAPRGTGRPRAGLRGAGQGGAGRLGAGRWQ